MTLWWSDVEKSAEPFRTLVREAVQQAQADGTAGRCWIMHRWGKFAPMEGAEFIWQSRQCQRCGLFQDKRR